MTKTYDQKATNPKDAIGSTKIDFSLIPSSALAYLATSFTEGALKYGRYNWRIAGVRASIYAGAMQRHFGKWWNGEDADPKTKVKHLSSVMACAAILLDAELCGKLNDDRPPMAPVGDLIDSLEATVAHLKKINAGCDPKQYTIADSVEPVLVAPRTDLGKLLKDKLDGWIEWKGGACPVSGWSSVVIRLRDDVETTHSAKAGRLRWTHEGGSGDIVAYKVVPTP